MNRWKLDNIIWCIFGLLIGMSLSLFFWGNGTKEVFQQSFIILFIISLIGHMIVAYDFIQNK